MIKPRDYVLLLLLACLWGPSFLLIKIAVGQASPLAVATLRILSGSCILIIVLKLRGTKVDMNWDLAKKFMVSGFFNMSLPYILIASGEQYIDSALAGILNGLTPFFALLFVTIGSREERLSTRKIIGVVLGFAGLCVLLFPHFRDRNMASLTGVLLVTVAAACYGWATVYTKKNLVGLPPLVAPAFQLLMGGILLIPVLLIFGEPGRILKAEFSFWLAIASLSLFGTALAYFLYFKIIENTEATFVALVTYIVPIISIALGILVLNEHITWSSAIGAVIILASIRFASGK
jgi:drug/metabolite transporter (DMT)-like permease